MKFNAIAVLVFCAVSITLAGIEFRNTEMVRDVPLTAWWSAVIGTLLIGRTWTRVCDQAGRSRENPDSQSG